MGGGFAEVKFRKKCHSLMAISDYLKDDSIALVLREIHRNLYLSYIQLQLKDRTWDLGFAEQDSVSCHEG